MLLLWGSAKTGTIAALHRCTMGPSNVRAREMRRNSAVLLRIGRVFKQNAMVLDRPAVIRHKPCRMLALQVSRVI